MRRNYVNVAFSFISATAIVSCADLDMEITPYEQYTRAFIREFGLIDVEQDWNMAKEGIVTLNVGETPADITIYAKYGGTYYLVADLPDMKGNFKVPFDIPEDCEEIMVNVNGAQFMGRIGDNIDVSTHPAKAPSTVSRSSEVDNDVFVYDPNDISFEKIFNGAKVTVSTPSVEPEYLYFNAQQMAPILQRSGAWADYISMTDGTLKTNDNNKAGILPEGSGNSSKTSNLSYTEGNAYNHSEVTQDFVYLLKDPQKGFDIYPMFYGSNLRHTLGIYLLDKDGNAIRDANDNIVKYPIYQSKHDDDIKVRDAIKDVYCGLKGGQGDGSTLTKLIKDRIVGAYDITITTGEPKYKLKLDFGDFIPGSYTTSIQNDSYNNQVSLTKDSSEDDVFWLSSNTVSEDNWLHIYVNIGSNKADLALKVKVVDKPATTRVKRIEFYDGDTKIDDPVGTGIVVGENQTKSYTIKCFDAVSGGNQITDSRLIAGEGWHNNIFTASLSGNTLSITGVSSTYKEKESDDPGVNWTAAWIDLKSNREPDTDEGEPATSLKVTVAATTTHTYSTTVTEWPSGLSSAWSSFFGNETGIWSGSQELSWSDNFSSLSAQSSWGALTSDHTKLRIEFTSSGSSQLKIVSNNSDHGYWLEFPIYTDINSPLEISLDQSLTCTYYTSGNPYELTTTLRDELASYGLIFQGYALTLTRISLVKEGGTPDWKSNGKSDVKNALENYYNHSYNLTGTCSEQDCDVQLSSTDASVRTTVTIPDDATYSNVKYNVTLTKSVVANRIPRKGVPKGPIFKSTSLKRSNSRAEDYATLTAPGGKLYHDNSTTWYNIRKAYNEITEKGDAYDYDEPLLIRSRGYHVDIKDIINDKDWYGYIGMYIDYDWGEDFESPDGSVNPNWTASGTNHWGRPKSGTHYSQSSENILEYGGKKYPISYAATFTHPKSSNQYLCFEDWDVTAPVGDYDTDGIQNTSASYTTWDWAKRDGDYSSDRDLNDIIYRQVGLIPQPTKEIKTRANGFTWIWALEDLGSTDDFDFNDVVIRIQSLTTKKQSSDDDKPELVKRIILTPRCAGGTLPIYIHFRYDESHDYVLEPGTWDLTNGTATPAGEEYHKWFGVNVHTKMINTGAGTTVSPSNIQSCTLIVPAGYKLNYMPTPGFVDSENHSYDAYTIDGYNCPIYATVNGATEKNNQQIDTDRLGATYKITLPDKGAAPQSFIIVEQKDDSEVTEDSDGNTTSVGDPVYYAHPWYWPKERAHILDAYPQFKQWIQSHNKADWYIHPNEKFLYRMDD